MIKNALYLIVAAALVAVGYVAYRKFNDAGQEQATSALVGDIPVVFRTNGGLLEVGKVVYKQQFTLKEAGTVFGFEIPGCPTEAVITVKAHFTYRVRLAPEWKAKITADKRVIVVAPPLEPAIPVAFDTAATNESLYGCPIIKDRRLLDRLRKKLSSKLAASAKRPEYKQLARPAAVKTVGEFIRKWYLERSDLSYAKDYPVVVYFKGEPIDNIM
jgi:hypothetical protein